MSAKHKYLSLLEKIRLLLLDAIPWLLLLLLLLLRAKAPQWKRASQYYFYYRKKTHGDNKKYITSFFCRDNGNRRISESDTV